MKKLISLFAIILLFQACSSIQETERRIIVTGFDFTKYAKKYFLFTPQPYLGDYDGIGLLRASIFPAVKKLQGDEQNVDKKKFLVEWKESSGWLIERIDPSDAIEEMYKIAVEMGADAVMNFSANTSSISSGTLNIPGYEVSGFAIKRKK